MSMADRDGFIWYDGGSCRGNDTDAHHSCTTACPFSRGRRAYNTVKGTAIFRLAEHATRLLSSGRST